MSSYIKYMFRYLFEADDLPADFGAANFSINSTGGEPAGPTSIGELNSIMIIDDVDQSDPATGPLEGGPSWPPTKCLALARLFFSALSNSSSSQQQTTTTTTTTTGGRAALKLGSFAEFEQLIRRQLSLVANLSGLDQQEQAVGLGSASLGAASSSHDPSLASEAAKSISSSSSSSSQLIGTGLGQHSSAAYLAEAGQAAANQSSGLWSLLAGVANKPNGPLHTSVQQQQPELQLGDVSNSFELLECYNQLQARDYYNGYDIFIGLRIATSLTILFIVFILFVIYKTGCRDENSSRSQLRLTSSSSSGGARGGSGRRWARQQQHPGMRFKSGDEGKKKATLLSAGGCPCGGRQSSGDDCKLGADRQACLDLA